MQEPRLKLRLKLWQKLWHQAAPGCSQGFMCSQLLLLPHRVPQLLCHTERHSFCFCHAECHSFVCSPQVHDCVEYKTALTEVCVSMRGLAEPQPPQPPKPPPSLPSSPPNPHSPPPSPNTAPKLPPLPPVAAPPAKAPSAVSLALEVAVNCTMEISAFDASTQDGATLRDSLVSRMSR